MDGSAIPDIPQEYQKPTSGLVIGFPKVQTGFGPRPGQIPQGDSFAWGFLSLPATNGLKVSLPQKRKLHPCLRSPFMGPITKREVAALTTITEGKSVSFRNGIAISIQQFNVLSVQHDYLPGF